jgi:peroxiredoxin
VQLRDRYSEIRSLGADLVAVGTGDVRYAQHFVAEENLPFLVLVDDDGAAAAAAQVRRASLTRLLAPTGVPAALRAYRSGARQHRSGARQTQLGATFVLGPGERVRYSHIDSDAADHAPLTEVLAALNG